MADKSHVTLNSLNASPICSKEATYPGHMLIRFWCDSDITFLHDLHKIGESTVFLSNKCILIAKSMWGGW